MLNTLAIILSVLTVLVPGNPEQDESEKVLDKKAEFSFRSRNLIAPSAIFAGGIAIHSFAHDTWDKKVNTSFSVTGDHYEIEGLLRFAPLAMDAGLGLLGARSRNSFIDRSLEAALAYTSLVAAGLVLKEAFHTERPDHSDFRSTPSGHTSVAFCGAELVRLEYGWGWGAGAYAVATSVGVLRLYHNRHWMSDVVMGAGLGILCADIGNWLLSPAKNVLGMNRKSVDVNFRPSVDPVSGAICPLLAIRF